MTTKYTDSLAVWDYEQAREQDRAMRRHGNSGRPQPDFSNPLLRRFGNMSSSAPRIEVEVRGLDGRLVALDADIRASLGKS